MRVGLLGLGTVGKAVLSILREQEKNIVARSRIRFEVTSILVRDVKRERPEAGGIPVTCYFDEVLATKPQIIIEAIGNLEPTYSYVLRALSLGISVVTANKMLVSCYYEQLSAAAAQSGAELLFEASVAGGIPVIRLLQTSLTAEPINRVSGILNGTTNYILSSMASEGQTFDHALRQAQQIGYAEADPSTDVEGYDALHKLQILAALALDVKLPLSSVQRDGIRSITPVDIQLAVQLGYTIKLLANLKRTEIGIEAWVGPTLIPSTHPLATVNGCNNAVCIEGQYVGKLTLSGPGAGGYATGSAVVADLVTVAARLGIAAVRVDGKRTSFHSPHSVLAGTCRSLLRLTHNKSIADSLIIDALKEIGSTVEQIAAIVVQEGTVHQAYIIAESSPTALHASLGQFTATTGAEEAVLYRIEQF